MLFDNFLFHPPKPPSYDVHSYPGEIVNLNGIICLALESEKPSAHVMIYCHANSSDIGLCRAYLAGIRDSLDLHVIAVEYPGYGFSEGSPSGDSLDHSVQTVYEFVCSELKWPKKSIIMVGRSIGTGPAVNIASKNELGAMVLLSSFTSIRDAAEGIVGKFGFLLQDRWKNLEKMSNITCPVLLLHGKLDQMIPPQHSLELFEGCQHKKKEIHYLDNTGHNKFNWMPIIKKINQFLTEQGIYNQSSDLLFPLRIPGQCFHLNSSQKRGGKLFKRKRGPKSSSSVLSHHKKLKARDLISEDPSKQNFENQIDSQKILPPPCSELHLAVSRGKQQRKSFQQSKEAMEPSMKKMEAATPLASNRRLNSIR